MNRTNWAEIHAWAWVVIAGALFGAVIYISIGGK